MFLIDSKDRRECVKIMKRRTKTKRNIQKIPAGLTTYSFVNFSTIKETFELFSQDIMDIIFLKTNKKANIY